MVSFAPEETRNQKAFQYKNVRLAPYLLFLVVLLVADGSSVSTPSSKRRMDDVCVNTWPIASLNVQLHDDDTSTEHHQHHQQ
eukprot:scaffold233_cov81-Cylindrotheca_fusiformis.AAC.9